MRSPVAPASTTRPWCARGSPVRSECTTPLSRFNGSRARAWPGSHRNPGAHRQLGSSDPGRRRLRPAFDAKDILTLLGAELGYADTPERCDEGAARTPLRSAGAPSMTVALGQDALSRRWARRDRLAQWRHRRLSQLHGFRRRNGGRRCGADQCLHGTGDADIGFHVLSVRRCRLRRLRRWRATPSRWTPRPAPVRRPLPVLAQGVLGDHPGRHADVRPAYRQQASRYSPKAPRNSS